MDLTDFIISEYKATSLTSEEQKAQDEGWEAFQKRPLFNENPYKEENLAYWWNFGYECGIDQYECDNLNEND
jgi:hypothetical protein